MKRIRNLEPFVTPSHRFINFAVSYAFVFGLLCRLEFTGGRDFNPVEITQVWLKDKRYYEASRKAESYPPPPFFLSHDCLQSRQFGSSGSSV
jgi:hypothetical protein